MVPQNEFQQHHYKNHNTKFHQKNIRGLVKTNWWLDATNKTILTKIRFSCMITSNLSENFF